MPQNGAVRGNFCSCAPHPHTQAEVPGDFRAWDEALTSHIVGEGYTPHHNSHLDPPCDGHDISLMHIHTQVATGTETFINDFVPLLETDEGCWSCPCHDGDIFDFTVGKNPYNCFIEDKSVLVQGNDMIISESLHDGSGKIMNGGSGDLFIGVFKTSPEPHG